jgi:pyridoxine 5-phosphate synthase
MTLVLSVNVDHIATLRQARLSPYPDPIEAALLAEQTGAAGITAHVRGDRRHIQDDDIRRLRQVVTGKFNLEMAATDDMVNLALAVKPEQVTLVPERPHELTTEGGLDFLGSRTELLAVAEKLRSHGIAVSLFLDPEPRQIEALAAVDRGLIPGFEINTDAYTKAFLTSPAAATTELTKVRAAAELGARHGLMVYAGHGLTAANVGDIAAIAPIEELNIGHWLISRAALVGLATAIAEMLSAMRAGRPS